MGALVETTSCNTCIPRLLVATLSLSPPHPPRENIRKHQQSVKITKHIYFWQVQVSIKPWLLLSLEHFNLRNSAETGKRTRPVVTGDAANVEVRGASS